MFLGKSNNSERRAVGPSEGVEMSFIRSLTAFHPIRRTRSTVAGISSRFAQTEAVDDAGDLSLPDGLQSLLELPALEVIRFLEYGGVSEADAGPSARRRTARNRKTARAPLKAAPTR